jgi:membrane associated rhomboid family serine protease
MGGLIPLGDASRRPRGAAFATLLIILVNIYVFFLELSGGERFVRAWSAIPVRITHGHHSITLLTSMFLHASWMHIIGNMIFLWAFGPAMEDVMGHARYVVFYLAGGVTAMMAQILAAPNSNISCLGASGAIAAVMGAFIVTFPRDRIRTLLWFLIFFRVTYIPAVLLIGFWILTQIWNVGAVTDAQSGGVAYMAHVGGFAFGLITGRFFVIRDRIGFGGGRFA